MITHNNTLEITWSVIPLLITFIVFGWGYSGWLNLKTVPDDAYEIHVTGFKWNWSVNYENGAQTINEIHVPKGTPIKLVMQSRDVLHSFFVPEYRVKHDVLPIATPTFGSKQKKRVNLRYFVPNIAEPATPTC